MIICHRKRFVYFAYPKTASETVRALLRPWKEVDTVNFGGRSREMPYYPHMSPVECRRQFQTEGRDFSEYLRITSVRNPWARFVSLYRMHQRLSDSGLSFEQYIGRIHDCERGVEGPWELQGMKSLQQFAGTARGGFLTNCYLRVERLRQDVFRLWDLLGLGEEAGMPEVPDLNSSGAYDYRAYYDPHTRELVGRMCGAEIEMFEYRF